MGISNDPESDGQTGKPSPIGFADGSAPQIDLDEIIQNKGSSRFAMMIMALAAVTMFLEGFEMQLVGYAAPAMIKALHADKAAFGAIFGANNFGYMLGALLLGYLGDRFGRRWPIIAGVCLFSIFTLIAAYGETVTTLAVLRFFAGVGLGGAVPNAIALATEYARRDRRATCVAWLYVGYTIGGACTGLIAARLLPLYGWPVIFSIGGWSGILMAAVLWLFLPESARFLAQRNPDEATLRSIVARLSPATVMPANARIILREERPKRIAATALFKDGRAPVTLLLWLAFICGIMASQFMTSWLPTLIASTGISLSLAIFTGALYHIGGTGGNVALGWMIDRKGIRMIAVGFLIAAPVVAAIGPAQVALPTLMLAVLLSGFFIVGSQNGLLAVASIVYPTWLRSSGTGWTTGIGRIGSIIGPVLGGFLVSLDMPISRLFLFVTIPLALTAAAVALLAGRSSISREPASAMAPSSGDLAPSADEIKASA